jgi:hypothetical protein
MKYEAAPGSASGSGPRAQVWIDIERMKGSTIEAMSQAVEHAAAVVYSVSLACASRAAIWLRAGSSSLRVRASREASPGLASPGLASRADKESANCRMEAQYSHQQEKEMIPLLVEEGYRPQARAARGARGASAAAGRGLTRVVAQGWLGMIFGVRLWYGFFGATLASEAAFDAKVVAAQRYIIS